MSIPFRAIVFDFDGLIVETEQPTYEAYRTVFEEMGAELPLSVWQEVMGSSGASAAVFVHLERTIGREVDREALRRQAHELRDDATCSIPPREGIPEFIAQAKEAGLALAVASSGRAEWVLGHLDRLGLLPAFDTVCTREYVRETKPHPALYQLAIERLGAKPQEAFAIEDSPNGITAAKAAGLRCIAVPNPFTAGMDLRQADCVLPSLADVSLADMVARLSLL